MTADWMDADGMEADWMKDDSHDPPWGKLGAISDRVNELTHTVIRSALQVHRELGPGLLETAYQRCLAEELRAASIAFEEQVKLPLRYREVTLDGCFRLDVVVQQLVLVEVKAVDLVLPVHRAQVLTYLRLSGLAVALLLNFNSVLLRDGIQRFVP